MGTDRKIVLSFSAPPIFTEAHTSCARWTCSFETKSLPGVTSHPLILASKKKKREKTLSFLSPCENSFLTTEEEQHEMRERGRREEAFNVIDHSRELSSAREMKLP